MRRKLPPWATGLAFAPLGFYFGYISTALPILLAAHGVPVGRIAEVSATGFSPTFWAFLLCPILDVRFTKRAYSLLFAGIAAVCLGASTLLTNQLGVLTLVVMTGCAAVVIFGNAIGGWLADVIEDKHYNAVGAWSNVANLGAAGAFGTLTIVLVRLLHAPLAAVLLGLTVMAPTVLLFFIPLPTVQTRGVAETFRTFFRDLSSVLRRPGCIFGLICFVSPASCFALTNLFSGMGKDFGVSENVVTAIGGTGVAIVCSVGCLVSIWICGRYKRRTVYLVAGFGGAVAAIAMIFTPHTLTAFAVGVLAYNFFQGINYTAFSALGFEIVGPGNPLAGTQMALLAAAANLPISYMTWIEGGVYARHGISGMFGFDAAATVITGTSLLVLFAVLAKRRAVRVGVTA